MKKVWSLFFCAVLALSLPFAALAEAAPRVVDEAGLLTDSEERRLEEKIAEIAVEYRFDVVIVTENSLGGKRPIAFADDYFDYNGYGYGPGRDGILFLISMEDRDWVISTRGYGITAFTDYGCDYIGEQVRPYLSDGEYGEAMEQFLDLSEDFLAQASTGTPYDKNHEKKNPLRTIAFSAVIGLITASVVTLVLKSQLKSRRPQASANQYVRNGSFVLRDNRDYFLYSHVTKTRRASESSGGGGSSTHIGSSGASHGGSSGKF